MLPLISIIIPVRNAALYIKDCLQSCLSQTYPNIEIVVIDDGSTDSTREVIQLMYNNASRINFIAQPQLGVTPARNRGLREANGKYIFFLDADDILPLNSIEILLKKALSTHCKVIIGCIDYVTEKGKRINLLEYHKEKIVSNEDRISYIRNSWMGHLAGILYEKSLFTPKLECPVELKIGEDLLQSLQILTRCNRVAYVSAIVYRYIQHNHSTINSQKLPNTAKESNEYLFITTLQNLNNNNAYSDEIKSEFNLISLFCALNFPHCSLRKSLIKCFSRHFLLYVILNFRTAKKLLKISYKVYLGAAYDVIIALL